MWQRKLFAISENQFGETVINSHTPGQALAKLPLFYLHTHCPEMICKMSADSAVPKIWRKVEKKKKRDLKCLQRQVLTHSHKKTSPSWRMSWSLTRTQHYNNLNNLSLSLNGLATVATGDSSSFSVSANIFWEQFRLMARIMVSCSERN